MRYVASRKQQAQGTDDLLLPLSPPLITPFACLIDSFLMFHSNPAPRSLPILCRAEMKICLTVTMNVFLIFCL